MLAFTYYMDKHSNFCLGVIKLIIIININFLNTEITMVCPKYI